MPSCYVPTCHNNSTSLKKKQSKSKVIFHRFPSKAKYPQHYRQWIIAMKRYNFEKGYKMQHAYVCSAHFLESDYDPASVLRYKLMSSVGEVVKAPRLLKTAVPKIARPQINERFSMALKKRELIHYANNIHEQEKVFVNNVIKAENTITKVSDADEASYDATKSDYDAINATCDSSEGVPREMSTQKKTRGRKKKNRQNTALVGDIIGSVTKEVDDLVKDDQLITPPESASISNEQELDNTTPSPVPSIVANKENAIPDSQAIIEPKIEPELDDPTCRSCWSTFPSVNELGIHIKKQHIVNRVCHRCGITSFPDWVSFETHHKVHVKERTVSVLLVPSAHPPKRRSVARKKIRSAPSPAPPPPPPQREPIKLTLRLTSGRQAKAAEEARAAEEAARKAEMLNVAESVHETIASPSPSSKEEDLYQKAITELNNLAQEIPPPENKSPLACPSPAPSFVLRFSPSPPPSTAPDSQHSGSQPSSRPSSVGPPTISVRTTESLLAQKTDSPQETLSNSVLRNILDKITSPQPNVQEPEFVSLERLADTVNMIGTPTPSPVLTSNTPPISTAPASMTQTLLQATASMQPLQNLAAMQPNPMLPNMLPPMSLSMPTDPLSTGPMQVSPNPQLANQNLMQANFQRQQQQHQQQQHQNQLVQQLLQGQNMQNVNHMQGLPCEVCGQRWPNMTALEAHRAVTGHYRCSICLQTFPSSQSLNMHVQSVHQQHRQQQGPMPPQYLQQNARNPPPLYRGPVTTMAPPYQPGPPPLVYQQHGNQAFRGQYRHMIQPPRPQDPMQAAMQHRAAMQQQQQQQYRPGQQRPGNPQSIRQAGPQNQQAMLRNVLQSNTLAQQQQQQQQHQSQQQQHQLQQQQTPTKRPAPAAASPPNKLQKRSDVGIPARQPEDCQIIAVQRGGDGVPQIQSVQGSASIPEKPANAPIVQLTNEITLSVRANSDAAKKTPQKSSNGANVASLLANRGITVTAANKNKTSESASPVVARPLPPAIPESLTMNSSISILPASRNGSSSQQTSSASPQSNASFAVPRSRPAAAAPGVAPDRPPRPPTVDLTSETAASLAAKSGPQQRRPPGAPYQCTICGRGMASAAALQQHMQVHHPQQAAQPNQQQAAQNKLPYRCNLCSASYPTIQGLQNHKQVAHKEPPPALPAAPSASDMGIPIVDLRAPGTVERLARLGIHHYIPLPSQSNAGFFSIPIVSAETARNPALQGLHSMNVTSVLPFGPLRALPR